MLYLEQENGQTSYVVRRGAAPAVTGPDIIAVVYPVPLAPLLVKKLLELLMGHNLLHNIANLHF